MNTHPHICYWLLARFSTKDLFALLDNTKHVHRVYREMRAVILIELAYRLRLRKPWVAEAIWNVMHRHEVPPPPGLMSPSEAFPQERRWATQH